MESYQKFVEFVAQHQAAFVALSIWSLVWKGLALWRAARQSQRNWFIAILVLNTIGILEMVYLFWFGKVARQGQTDNTKLE